MIMKGVNAIMADIFKTIRIKNGEAISNPVPIGVEDKNVEITNSTLKAEGVSNLDTALEKIMTSLIWHES